MAEVNYNFDTTQWTNLKQNIKNTAQPNRNVSFCSDYGFCQESFGTRSYGYGEYVAYYRLSSSTQHSNSHTQYYPGCMQHGNSRYSGSGLVHYNDSRHSNCYQGSSGCRNWAYHGNYSKEAGSHGNYTAHGNACSNYYGQYSQVVYSCYDVSYHYNSLDYCYQCSQTYAYNDSVGLTTNIPNAPVLLGTESGNIPKLAKTVTLALFSYDKDYNSSSASTEEKEVYYDLYIQRIQDKDGKVLTGQTLVKILSNAKESAIGEGVTFNFDSTAYPDGYYRFIAVARNAPKNTSYGTYYMQDVAGTNITASGNYNGSDLFSGLSFPPGTRATTVSANSKKIKSGSLYEMVSISKVLIKQNTPSFMSIKNASTSILNFIFANDDSNETDEGRYSVSANVKQVYGQSGIADGDSYITLRGWTNGLVAKIDVEERDTSQYVKVTGTLYRKSDGTMIPGSTVTAQFPINKSSASSYTEIKAAGGAGVKMEGYLYWPASIFNSATNLVNGLEDVEIRLTTYEYDDTAGTKQADNPRTTSSVETYVDGSENATRAVFSVDKFSPSVSNNAVQNTWMTSSTVTITVDDRFLNNAVNASGTSSNLDRILVIVVDRKTGTVLSTYDWSTSNGVIPANTKNFSKAITINYSNYYENIGLDITAWDKVGNSRTQSISNIKIDNSTTTVTISPAPTDNWSKSQITPAVTFSKPGGTPFTKIQIAETNSATPPADGSSEWKVVASELGTSYTYQTTSAGRTTNTHYVHVIVDDGLHPTIRKTFGPYKVDLEAPSVAITSTAGSWMYKPTVSIAVTDSAVGSKLKSVKYTWKKTDGSTGGTQTIDLSASNVNTYSGTYTIDIPDNTYENNISCTVEVTDNAGNVFKSTITDLKADKTSPTISINPVNDSNWHNTKINTITTISKSTGAPCSVIKIAETNSATPPAENDSAWKNVAISNGGAIYPNQTTGQMSGQHYVHVWVEKGTYDPSNPSSKKILKTFGPYKVDLILPEMIDFEVASTYAQKYGWYWEIPTFNVDVVDKGGSGMNTLKYIISPSPTPPTVSSSWKTVSPSATRIPVTFPVGKNYVHVYMKDNASNEQTRTNPTTINVDETNPVIEVNRTIISDTGAVNANGKIVGYVNFEISADDAVSGIKVAKYAITDSPTPPPFTQVGNNNASNLGRTDGWIDFSAYSDIGVSVDLKAPGKSYVYVYVEDNAGRKYNSTLATINAADTQGIYKYAEEIDIIPTYLYELDVDASTSDNVVTKDYANMSTGVKNIFALKNISNITNFNLYYVNYQSNAQQALKIDIIDCKTGSVVRTTRTLVAFDYGDTQVDDIQPYNFPVWWVNGTTGQKLPSGVYEVRASLLDGENVVNSISAFAIIKQNTLQQPVITYSNLGNEASISAKFYKDTFYDDLKANGYTDSLVTSFINDLATSYKTKYSTNLIDRLGAENNTVHNPTFNAAGEYTYTTSTKKFVTVVATIEDAFGNVTRTSQTVDFFSNGEVELTPEEAQKKEEGAKKINNTTSSVKLIETPSAENYIINGSKQSNDKVDENPFDFLNVDENKDDENPSDSLK